MSSSLEHQVVLRVRHCLECAAEAYQREFSVSEIRFDLSGRAAGQVRFPQNRRMFGSTLPLMRFNKVLLESYAEDFINEVVPHECAHVVVYHLNRSAFHSGSKRPKPHGIEWQSVMRDVYRLEPKVTHNFALTSSESRQYSYVCGCVQRIHRISIIRHNKIKRGRARYLCKGCGDALVESVADSVSQNRG